MSILKWENNADYFECWKRIGLTGFPVVDAAMRCFQQTTGCTIDYG